MTLTKRVRVLILSADEKAAAFMQTTLSALSRYDGEVVAPEVLAGPRSTVNAEDFDVVVLDVGDGRALEDGFAQELRRRLRSTPLIVVSDELDDQHMRLLLRLNGNDWLRKPLERKSFIDAITGNTDIGQPGGNHVHAVMSAVGGAGATSVAASLADALVRAKRKNETGIALFDLDFSTGAAGQYLNLVNDYDLRPVLQKPERVDLELIDIVKKKHERGFSLLSFKQPDVLLMPTGRELVLRMLDVVSFQNNHTVLDVPYYETAWKNDIISSVNTIHIVTELTIPGLRHAKDLYSRINKLRKDDVKIHVIANKHRRKLFTFGIGKRDTRKVFSSTQIVIVDDDWSTMSEAINRGTLPHEVSPRSKFVRAVEKMAELV